MLNQVAEEESYRNKLEKKTHVQGTEKFDRN